MTSKHAADLILASEGKFLTVEFVKRTSGEIRKMNCRLGVKVHLKGGEKSFDDKTKHLITVYDIGVAGYRSIPIEGIRKVSIGGETYNVV